MSNPKDDAGRARGELSPEERARIERRLSDLGQKLDKADPRKAEQADGDVRGRAMSLGFGIAAQLVAGVGLGLFVGYWLDGWLGTAPWLLVLFLFLGFAAGMLNVVRSAREMQKISEAQSKGAKSVPFDDDEDR